MERQNVDGVQHLLDFGTSREPSLSVESGALLFGRQAVVVRVDPSRRRKGDGPTLKLFLRARDEHRATVDVATGALLSDTG
jgi:imidazole glycerol phosphate synthase subunit HisF